MPRVFLLRREKNHIIIHLQIDVEVAIPLRARIGVPEAWCLHTMVVRSA